MRLAFKEWAVIVDALGAGDQVVILRKGGINEGASGFRVDNDRFLLFPTLYHQQRAMVLPAAQARFDRLAAALPPADRVRIEFWADVQEWVRLESREAALNLRGQHVWRDEVIADRFEWGRTKAIYALAVRVFRLPCAVELPLLPEYGGCKSWIELGSEIPTDGSVPVLDDPSFGARLDALRAAWGRPLSVTP
ncbi:MAG TPA: DUF1802 family protein [Methylomirabilota bacterium]|nr:DUF1802 family protein [Methylomirabilota bacterium]